MAEFKLNEFKAGNISVCVGSGGALRLYDAVLRYYNHEEPDRLDDGEWAEHIQDVHWLRKQEAKNSNVPQ